MVAFGTEDGKFSSLSFAPSEKVAPISFTISRQSFPSSQTAACTYEVTGSTIKDWNDTRQARRTSKQKSSVSYRGNKSVPMETKDPGTVIDMIYCSLLYLNHPTLTLVRIFPIADCVL